MNISSFKDFINKLEKYGDRISIRERNNGIFINYTYFDLIRDATKIAENIKNSNISNRNIAIIGENSYKWIATFLGVIMSNNVVIPLNKDIQSDIMNVMLEK